MSLVIRLRLSIIGIMTLIMTYVTPSHVIQASDRRLTANGKLYDERANKAICISCSNGHFAIAYTGLAVMIISGKRKRTDEIIVDYLADIGAGNMTTGEVAAKLAEHFEILVKAQRLPSENDKRLTLVLAGYCNNLPFVGGVSNFEDKSGQILAVGTKFNEWIHVLKVSGDNPRLIMVNGCEAVVYDTFWPSIEHRLKKLSGQSAQEVSEQLVLLIRWAAHDKKFGKYIGQDIMSTIIPASGDFEASYYPLKAESQSYAPHLIQPNMSFKGLEVWYGEKPPWWKD